MRVQMRVPFAKVVCDGNELRYVAEVIESGWLTTGGKTQMFERAFAQMVGARFAYAVNSCTAALHLALEAAGIRRGDKVLVPTMTFTATAEVVRYLGADPVFLDVEYGSGLLEPERVADALERWMGVKAVMVVDFGGQPAAGIRPAGEGILDICREAGVWVIEDAAHAFPARVEGKMVGQLADVTCFSFYANKTITTGEGGMLTTEDEAVAKRVRCMRLHGIDRDVWDRYSGGKGKWEYDVIAPGFKYNMPDIAAAIGLAQLERAFEFHRERQRCASYYLENLQGIGCLDLPLVHVPLEDHAWHLFHVTLTDDAPMTRDQFIARLAEAGIGTSVHYKPLHRMSYYRNRYGLRPEEFPNAERMWKGCVSLPIYPSLTDEDLAFVCETIRRILS